MIDSFKVPKTHEHRLQRLLDPKELLLEVVESDLEVLEAVGGQIDQQKEDGVSQD
jgi:hypothetical protein